jgi:site-specific DNA recombinase
MKAAIYTRFSTDKQRDASIEDQVRECERAAKAAGLAVVARFEDRSISGGTATRPGYQALLAAARRREFNVIVVEDISRLWRNRAEFGPRSAELEDLGVHCLTCVGDDTRRDGWGLVIQIKQAVAEHARREASYRTRRGLEGRAVAGASTGGRVYGYVPARDAAGGRIEINPEQAEVVRRIFAAYASGMSTRAIAASLNADGVPSPGSAWKRKVRRGSGWLASALHGDVKRGTGILNNRRYIGITTWGRSEWKRSAADSAKRRMTMNAVPSHEQTDDSLRIVPQELWDRVKARQDATRRGIGALVKGGLRKNGPGAGRPPKYLFSGLLACAECGASFVLRNRTCYACASWWNGAACANSINVSKDLVQEILLGGIQEDLHDPAIVDEFESRFKLAMRKTREAVPDQKRRIAALEREVANLADAIASGALRGSTTIAQRLRAAEDELERLRSHGHQAKRARPAVLVPDIRGQFLGMVDGLQGILLRDPERGREELRGIIEGKVLMVPDESRRFLWADYSLGMRALLTNAEIMVAGAGFEPATFGL